MMRFIDRKDLDSLIASSPDFKKRYYGSAMKIASCLLILVVIISVVSANRVIAEMGIEFDILMQSKVLKVILLMAAAELVVVGYLYYVIMKLRHSLTAIDFQITLFAGAMRGNTSFCIIANSKNKIVYADKGAMDIFSKDNVDSMDSFLKHSAISDDMKKKIKLAIKTSASQEAKLTYKENDKKKTCEVLISALDKPKGYFCIKGMKA